MQEGPDTPSGGTALLVEGPFRDVLWPDVPPDVIVVDADPELAELVAHTFQRAGCNTEICASLEAMRSLVAGAPPGVLILDYALPDGDATEACEELRANGFIGALIVMMDDAKALDPRLSGADDRIVKPFRMKDLVLQAVARMRRVAGAVTTPPPSARVKAAAHKWPTSSEPPSSIRRRRPVPHWDEIKTLLANNQPAIDAKLSGTARRMLGILQKANGGPIPMADLMAYLDTSAPTVSRSATMIRDAVFELDIGVPCRRLGYALTRGAKKRRKGRRNTRPRAADAKRPRKVAKAK